MAITAEYALEKKLYPLERIYKEIKRGLDLDKPDYAEGFMLSSGKGRNSVSCVMDVEVYFSEGYILELQSFSNPGKRYNPDAIKTTKGAIKKMCMKVVSRDRKKIRDIEEIINRCRIS